MSIPPPDATTCAATQPCHTSTPSHHDAPLPPLRSNTTVRYATVGPYVDGMITSEPYPFSKAFTVSASLDPGQLARHR